MNTLTTVLALFLVCLSPVCAQDDGQLLDVPLFEASDVLDVTLLMDRSAVLADIGEDREQHPAIVTYEEDGHIVSVPLKVKTRGNWRRNPEHCNFPPLRLNFAKKTARGSVFEGLDKVKLVTHCQTEKPDYEQYVVHEYLIYNVYNQLTDVSFRARMLRITYDDTAGRLEPLTRLAFLIEDEEVMAGRQEAEVFDREDIEKAHIDHDQTTLLYLFAYMIGNIDFSVPIHHNMKLIGDAPDKTLMPVPYDFDHASVINTEYADRAPAIGTASMRYQLFREFCRSDKELKPFMALFNDRRDAIVALYEQTDELEDAERRRALRQYDRFYEVLNDEAAFQRTFMNPCDEKG